MLGLLKRFGDARNGLGRLQHRLGHIDSDIGLVRRELEEMRREQRLLLGALTLPQPEARLVQTASQGAGAAGAFPFSTLCRQESFSQPWFADWTAQLHDQLRYHRKLWEFVYILQALFERGALYPGARGLGFGVGEERLSALFAAKGCRIVATDMAADDAAAIGWAETAQHAASLDALRAPSICPDDVFDQAVSFRPCDMNAIPPDLTGFDFCWSACALEHLGSIAKGLDFIENSIACLRPGGWAVHTTEFNMSSDDDTVDHAGTVLFRRRDLAALAARLTARGHRVAPLDFTPGEGEVDRYIDVAPYRADPHLRLALAGYATTSFGIIVQRGA